MFPELDLNKYSPKNVLALHKIVETEGLINITKWCSVETDPTITQVEFFKKDAADDVGSSSFPTPGVYLFSYFFLLSHSSIFFSFAEIQTNNGPSTSSKVAPDTAGPEDVGNFYFFYFFIFLLFYTA